ncbi:hypothetical protein CUJ84_Chr001975 [Rhizobium leguminosarum]|uniref:Uncharacterized protein n=1 Tax=Rhizobium leguminosarum TaxID=384 RepID=A0A2K9Z278_RHILE|nr:hypothetical protein CUJ84_Chr001975 [Rhizobium leguminosarum]
MAVLVALLTSLHMLFMAAAAGSAGLRVAAGRGVAGIRVVLVTLLPSLDVLFMGSTLVCHSVLLGC